MGLEDRLKKCQASRQLVHEDGVHKRSGEGGKAAGGQEEHWEGKQGIRKPRWGRSSRRRLWSVTQSALAKLKRMGAREKLADKRGIGLWLPRWEEGGRGRIGSMGVRM